MDPVTVAMVVVAVAQMVTSSIASEKAAKADALEKQALFDMLDGIAIELRGVSEQVGEILVRINELPAHIQNTMRDFEHAEYRARIIGAYEDFIDEQKGLLAREDWHDDVEIVTAYRDRLSSIYFDRLEPARSELRNFPRLDSVIPILTMALALKAEIEISNEIQSLETEINVVPDLERYREYFLARAPELQAEVTEIEGRLEDYYEKSEETYHGGLQHPLASDPAGVFRVITKSEKIAEGGNFNVDSEQNGNNHLLDFPPIYRYEFDTYEITDYDLEFGGALHKIEKTAEGDSKISPAPSWWKRNIVPADIEQFNRGTLRDIEIYDAVAKRATILACQQAISVIDKALGVEAEFEKAAEAYDV